MNNGSCIHFRTTQKAIQSTDLQVKILKQGSKMIGNYTCHFFKACVDEGNFPSILKHAQKEAQKDTGAEKAIIGQ